MPKLHGYVLYQFVEPGFVHPKGWQVDVVTKESLTEPTTDEQFGRFLDKCAARQETFADLCELDTAQCAKYGHRLESRPPNERAQGIATACADGPRHPDRLPNEPFCVTRARLARQATRTPERSVFVRIQIPVDEAI